MASIPISEPQCSNESDFVALKFLRSSMGCSENSTKSLSWWPLAEHILAVAWIPIIEPSRSSAIGFPDSRTTPQDYATAKAALGQTRKISGIARKVRSLREADENDAKADVPSRMSAAGVTTDSRQVSCDFRV